MRSSAKTVGTLMAGGGSLLLLAVLVWGLLGKSNGDLETTGFVLLVILALIVLLPLILGGLYMVLRGRAETKDLAEVDKQRKLLNLVQTRGQVSISDLVLDMQSNRDAVQHSLTELVGRGLFSGYVDWQKGMLYSVEASQLQGRQTCPNCGGQLQLAGKGHHQMPLLWSRDFSVLARELTDMDRVTNILSSIPGYDGYRDKENRRETDKRVRERISSRLGDLARGIEQVATDLANKRDIQAVGPVDSAAKSVRHLQNLVSTATYGYGGLYSDRNVDEVALEQLNQFDADLLTRVETLAPLVEQPGRRI